MKNNFFVNSKSTFTFPFNKINSFNFHRTNLLLIKNYYKILEISVKASEAQIKKAFIKFAKVYHPDVNKSPGSKEKFSEILEAYDVLSEESKRQIYDKSGLTATQQEDIKYEASINKIEPGFYEKQVEYSSDEDLDLGNTKGDDNFLNLFNRVEETWGSNKIKQQDTNDTESSNLKEENSSHIVFELNLSFFEYLKGCKKQIIYKKNLLCPVCKGEFCQKCLFTGFKSQDVVEIIDIPPGIEFNTVNNEESFVLKLKKKGNDYKSQNGINCSDLFVKIKVSDHDYFKKKGNNILTENYISLSQYLLGAKITIATVKGNKEIEIIPYRDKVIIKNYGLNEKGDHIAKLNIRLPKNLNKEQIKIFSDLKKIGF